MKKITILLLCCGVLIGTVGCGGNTAPPPTESLTTVSEVVITEAATETILPVTAIKPTEEEKEHPPTESKAQATEPPVTAPTTAVKRTEETMPIETATSIVTNTAEETIASQITETASSATPQFVESESTKAEPSKEEPKVKTEPPKVTDQEATENPTSFDIEHWIAYARSYAEIKGLVLSDTAVDCWDNPIRAGAHCIYLERDIKSRLNRYAKDEDITDVWIWAEATGNDCYDLYIGYA